MTEWLIDLYNYFVQNYEESIFQIYYLTSNWVISKIKPNFYSQQISLTNCGRTGQLITDCPCANSTSAKSTRLAKPNIHLIERK